MVGLLTEGFGGGEGEEKGCEEVEGGVAGVSFFMAATLAVGLSLGDTSIFCEDVILFGVIVG